MKQATSTKMFTMFMAACRRSASDLARTLARRSLLAAFTLLAPIGVCIVIAAIGAPAAFAEEGPSVEEAAAKIQAATVTVRVSLVGETSSRKDVAEGNDGSSNRGSEASDDLGAADEGDARADTGDTDTGDTDTDGAATRAGAASRVTVCSGVSLGEGLIVSSVFAAADSRIRVTLPGGAQSEAKLLVLDDFTGLALLQMERRDVASVETLDKSPGVGAWVVSAAAWGAEPAVVSFGVVSGVDRMLEGGHPPLLQCDLRTDETSAGAGIVDRQGRLVGIVIGAERADRGRGWTYAVPAAHVRRLLNARAEAPLEGSAVILKRRRPSVGMVLESEDGKVVVRRVEKGSPAERAGIAVGDVIVAADGVNIRSVYQAVRPVLHKQPGDEVEFLVVQDGLTRRMGVILSGGVELPAASLERIAEVVQPRFQIEAGNGFYATRNSRGVVREVLAPSAGDGSGEPTYAERLAVLERAIDRYLSIIAHLREELGQSEQERVKSERLIESLETEVSKLKAELKSAAPQDQGPTSGANK